MTDPTPPRRRGRPLSFDRDAALEQAMLLFWRHGYEATSLSDLTAAMGVTPPSIYAAFGDKRALFREAVHRYLSGGTTSESLIAGAKTARDAAWDLLQAAATGFTGASTPPGCLLASAAISCSPDAADVQHELAGIRRGIEAQLCARILEAVRDGELPADADADALAGHVMAVIQGLSTLARDGATREKLLRVAASAMNAWPEVDARRIAPLTREERRSLLLHEAIAARLRAEPEAVLARARASLARMRALHPGARPLLDEWRCLLRRPLDALLPVLTDPMPWARELRHVTPFTGILSAAERAQVYRAFAERERDDASGHTMSLDHAS